MTWSARASSAGGTVRPSASVTAATLVLGLICFSSGVQAQVRDKLLDEAVEFTGAVLFLESKVPALVIGAVRNGAVSVAGFGKVRSDADRAPDGKSLFRIGSITKAFTGAVLASLVADGVVKFTDPLQKHLGWEVKVPSKDGNCASSAPSTRAPFCVTAAENDRVAAREHVEVARPIEIGVAHFGLRQEHRQLAFDRGQLAVVEQRLGAETRAIDDERRRELSHTRFDPGNFAREAFRHAAGSRQATAPNRCWSR